MPNDNENTASADFRSMIAPQEEVVDKIAAKYKENPADDVLLVKLQRETDLLRHYINAAKGDPKSRARTAAEIAKRSILSKAITQPLK